MIDTLHDMLRRDPFTPFAPVLTSGNRYEVLTPDQIAMLESQIFYAYPRSDRFAFIRMNQLAAIESMDSAEQ